MTTTGYSVTLHVYNTLGIPHAFVTINTVGQAPVTLGYYPAVHSVAAAGVVKNDGLTGIDPSTNLPAQHPDTWARTFDVSPGQAQAMLAYSAQIANNPGN